MKLKVTKEVFDALVAQGKRELPFEACGYLAEKDGVVVKHYELTNLDKSHEHFTMEPKEQFAAIKAIRDDGLTVAAVYHTHPETPSRPSEEDIKLAFDPNTRYSILSLASETPVLNSFFIKRERWSLKKKLK